MNASLRGSTTSRSHPSMAPAGATAHAAIPPRWLSEMATLASRFSRNTSGTPDRAVRISIRGKRVEVFRQAQIGGYGVFCGPTPQPPISAALLKAHRPRAICLAGVSARHLPRAHPVPSARASKHPSSAARQPLMRTRVEPLVVPCRRPPAALSSDSRAGGRMCFRYRRPPRRRTIRRQRRP